MLNETNINYDCVFIISVTGNRCCGCSGFEKDNNVHWKFAVPAETCVFGYRMRT